MGYPAAWTLEDAASWLIPPVSGRAAQADRRAAPRPETGRDPADEGPAGGDV